MMIVSSGSRIVGDGVLFDIRATEVTGRKRSLDNEVISVHVDIVKVQFLMDQLFTLADARDAAAVALDSSREV